MAKSTTAFALLLGLGSLPQWVAAAQSSLKVETHDDIVASSTTLAHDLMGLYKGNQSGQIPGLLSDTPPNVYYWWESGAFWGTFVDYWHLTGDSSYNDVVTQGVLHQTGNSDNFMPPNQTASLGNSDQCYWALTAMLAAENQFPNPSGDGPQWITLAKNAFDTQYSRLQQEAKDDQDCRGGLRWQIPLSNNGYDYKNSISNGCFFNLGARLARYTGNSTYSDAAVEAFDWLLAVGFIDNETWSVYDGAHVEQNCTDINKAQFSDSAAVITQGAAFMYNITNGSDLWKGRLDNLSKSLLGFFFPEGIAVERVCEDSNTCTTDMLAMKGFLHRWLAVVTQVAPYKADEILPVLTSSARAAAAQCTGGDTGRQCGFYWANGTYVAPKTSGVGEEMDVLAAVSSLLITGAKVPATNATKTTGDGGSGGSGGGSGTGTGTGSAPSATKSSAASGGRAKMGGLVVVAAGLGAGWLW